MSEPTTRYLVGQSDAGKRLDRFLQERIPRLSRGRIQRMVRERVRLSWDVRARCATPVRSGGEVWIEYTPPAEELLEIVLPVLARGCGWLAVDKPPGIPVHPVHRVLENSLIRILRRQEGRNGLRLAHRLDRETSGVLLVAEDSATARKLGQAFLASDVDKEYLARVAGTIAADTGTIELPVGPAVGSRVYTRQGTEQGKPARTDWRVARRFGDSTLVHLYPRTGRRHQLRVHLAAIGHPILGDILYGRDDADYLALVSGEGDVRQRAGGPRRQLLHCSRLVFPDPAGQGRREVFAPLPADFALADGSGAESA